MPVNQGRHDRDTQAHQAARYRLRTGMARVALQIQDGRDDGRDAAGRPLTYATEMAQRHSRATLTKWARNARKTVVIL